MSVVVMARISRLSSSQLNKAECHGRREDKSSRQRLMRDAEPITWSSDPITDPLSLRELYERHVDGAFRPVAKAIALHLLVKLPSSVAVETDAEARKAIKLAVDFAQETFGNNAVFAARMDRDETSLTNVDLFLAPRYVKKTKHDSKDAISISRHLKMLAKKYRVGPPGTDCWDSADDKRKDEPRLREQGSALQDAFADFLLGRGYEARRGVPKPTPSPDWMSPEMYGAKKDREIAYALNREAEEKLQNANFLVAEANQKLKIAEKIQHAAASEARGAEQLRLEAKRDAMQARSDKLSAETFHIVAYASKEQADHQTKVAIAQHAAATSKLAAVDTQQKLLTVERDAVQNERSAAEKAKTEAREAVLKAEETKRQTAEVLASIEARKRALEAEREALHRSMEHADTRHRDILKQEKALNTQQLELIEKRSALDIECEVARSRLSTVEEREAAVLEALNGAKQDQARALAMRHGIAAWMRGDIVRVKENDRGDKIMYYIDDATKERIAPLINAAQHDVAAFVIKGNKSLQSLIREDDIDRATHEIARERVTDQMIENVVRNKVSVFNAVASVMAAQNAVAVSPRINQLIHAYNQRQGNGR